MLEMLLGPAGGFVGVIGALFKHGIEVYQEKKKAEADLLIAQENHRHEAVMADKQAALIQLEADNAVALAEINRQKELDVGAYNALAASYESDKATFSDAPASPWMIAVDAARGFIRPILTVIFSLTLIAMTAWLYINVPDAVTGDPDFMKQTFYRLIDALIFLATSACGWWFAARGISGRN